jgi:hypothetical protein
MLLMLSPAMINSIEEQVAIVRKNGGFLDVYKTAEKIRLQHISDNVAREDIIEKLMFFAGNVPIELNSKYEGEALVPIITGVSRNGSFEPLNSQ